jgi:chaperonin GroEL (HSP60 family)
MTILLAYSHGLVNQPGFMGLAEACLQDKAQALYRYVIFKDISLALSCSAIFADPIRKDTGSGKHKILAASGCLRLKISENAHGEIKYAFITNSMHSLTGASNSASLNLTYSFF